MTPELKRKSEEIVLEALGRAPRERAAYVAQACGGDIELQTTAEWLLASQDETIGLLAQGAVAKGPAGPADSPLAPGDMVAHYQVVRELGRGGMGLVFEGQDQRLGRPVAIKLLTDSFASEPSRVQRFEREARVVSALNHPNIITIHEI